jgi:Protein of unknown function (DUF2971)
MEQSADQLAFCLSEDSDLLSQWRGYAADATGLAIGFSVEALRSMGETFSPDSLVPVMYAEQEHERVLQPLFDWVKQIASRDLFTHRPPPVSPPGAPPAWSSEAWYSQEQFRLALLNSDVMVQSMHTLQSAFRMKSSAFHEEREWRLLSHRAPEPSVVQYRERNNWIVPYRVVGLPWASGSQTGAIVDVVLGPKNPTSIGSVIRFLSQSGLGPVKARVSAASYR